MIFGKPLSSYLRFSGGPAIIVFLVGMTRLVLSLNGAPEALTKAVSVTAVFLLAVIYLAVRTHISGFGTYKHLFPVILIPNAAMHIAASIAIAFAIYTGQANIFTRPEFAFGEDGRTWAHVAAHLTLGMIVGGLAMCLVGCLIMWITRLVTKGRVRSAQA